MRKCHQASCAPLVLAAVAMLAVPPTGATEGVSLAAVPICYNFACRARATIAIPPSEWSEVADWFATPALNAAQERDQIRKAVGWLEVIAGRYTPIHRDKPQNEVAGGSHGQMDCIDESLNVTTFLALLERQGLLRFHRVVERAYRRTMWDQHWAGQIEDLTSGERWVVDSWFHEYGRLPYVQTAVSWGDIPFFFSSFRDNSPD
jgi:hypothetical protein